ncbi:unnamed protein product [Anisakis simplex]|uniref:RQC domain-containing protein n=1 Tax=Anisakis simplex TaxID=6269 RepID=A0A0M3JHW5_ANISI|nr:unnamed protein product [Anisakis simplex]
MIVMDCRSLQWLQNNQSRLPMFGVGVHFNEMESARFMRKLVIEGYICEKLYNTAYDSTVAYTELTRKGLDLACGRIRPKVIVLIIRVVVRLLLLLSVTVVWLVMSLSLLSLILPF